MLFVSCPLLIPKLRKFSNKDSKPPSEFFERQQISLFKKGKIVKKAIIAAAIILASSATGAISENQEELRNAFGDIAAMNCYHGNSSQTVPLSVCLNDAKAVHEFFIAMIKNYGVENAGLVAERCNELVNPKGKTREASTHGAVVDILACTASFIKDAKVIVKQFGDELEFSSCVKTWADADLFPLELALIRLKHDYPNVYERYENYKGKHLYECE